MRRQDGGAEYSSGARKMIGGLFSGRVLLTMPDSTETISDISYGSIPPLTVALVTTTQNRVFTVFSETTMAPIALPLPPFTGAGGASPIISLSLSPCLKHYAILTEKSLIIGSLSRLCPEVYLNCPHLDTSVLPRQPWRVLDDNGAEASCSIYSDHTTGVPLEVFWISNRVIGILFKGHISTFLVQGSTLAPQDQIKLPLSADIDARLPGSRGVATLYPEPQDRKQNSAQTIVFVTVTGGSILRFVFDALGSFQTQQDFPRPHLLGAIRGVPHVIRYCLSSVGSCVSTLSFGHTHEPVAVAAVLGDNRLQAKNVDYNAVMKDVIGGFVSDNFFYVLEQVRSNDEQSLVASYQLSVYATRQLPKCTFTQRATSQEPSTSLRTMSTIRSGVSSSESTPRPPPPIQPVAPGPLIDDSETREGLITNLPPQYCLASLSLPSILSEPRLIPPNSGTEASSVLIHDGSHLVLIETVPLVNLPNVSSQILARCAHDQSLFSEVLKALAPVTNCKEQTLCSQAAASIKNSSEAATVLQNDSTELTAQSAAQLIFTGRDPIELLDAIGKTLTHSNNPDLMLVYTALLCRTALMHQNDDTRYPILASCRSMSDEEYWGILETRLQSTSRSATVKYPSNTVIGEILKQITSAECIELMVKSGFTHLAAQATTACGLGVAPLMAAVLGTVTPQETAVARNLNQGFSETTDQTLSHMYEQLRIRLLRDQNPHQESLPSPLRRIDQLILLVMLASDSFKEATRDFALLLDPDLLITLVCLDKTRNVIDQPGILGLLRAAAMFCHNPVVMNALIATLAQSGRPSVTSPRGRIAATPLQQEIVFIAQVQLIPRTDDPRTIDASLLSKLEPRCKTLSVVEICRRLRRYDVIAALTARGHISTDTGVFALICACRAGDVTRRALIETSLMSLSQRSALFILSEMRRLHVEAQEIESALESMQPTARRNGEQCLAAILRPSTPASLIDVFDSYGWSTGFLLRLAEILTSATSRVAASETTM